jgi:ATP-dependent exoDNAse (exonuclease V) beta subunit
VNVGKYQDWVDSFLNYRNLSKWRAVCSEFRMIDRSHDIAGTLDLILKHVDTGRVVLCDYKTKNPGFSKSNHRVQMGGYLSLLQHTNPAFHVDSVRIYWVTNEETTTTEYDVLDCLKQYEQARSSFFAKQLPW